MDSIHKVNISQVAAQLPFPFSMVDLAFVDDIAVSVYICQGMLGWHKHIDNDELFWVHEGSILLESEWGDAQLEPGEMAVVPKGVRHRTSSDRRSSVLLIRCGVMPHRKNGRRRIYALPGAGELKRASLFRMVQGISLPLKFKTVLPVEDSVIQVAWGEGAWPVEMRPSHAVMYLVLSGTATIITTQDMLSLLPDELTVIPKGLPYQLGTGPGTKLVRLSKARR